MNNDAYTPNVLESLLIPATVTADEPAKAVEKLPRENRYARLAQAKYRGVRLGTFGFVLEPAALYEIVESARISPIPGVTSLCKGLVNHRSNVVPVYDITELADTKPKVWERKRLLILDSRESAVGVLLYDLPVQITIDDPVQSSEITDVPEIFHRHSSGGYWSGSTLWLDLNRDSFFTELNTLCLRAA
ncbi:MAG TPA: chemotaxis protein CheW [Gammaproteobacteria bacterium]